MDSPGMPPLRIHDIEPKPHVGAPVGKSEFPTGNKHQMWDNQLEQPAQSNLQMNSASLYHLAATTWETLNVNHIAEPSYPIELWVIIINYCFKALIFRVVFYTTSSSIQQAPFAFGWEFWVGKSDMCGCHILLYSVGIKTCIVGIYSLVFNLT